MFRVLLLFFILFVMPAQAAERLLVFAAASQKNALDVIGQEYERLCACEVVISYAATSTLARQIDAGAEADVFISANEAWADWLEIRGNLQLDTRAHVAGNRLVIASLKKPSSGLDILSEGKFAMADPISVPAGIYAREALETMGIWKRVKKNAVYSENVRVALSSIKRGDLLSGIVYQSDLMQVDKLHPQFVFPDDSHSTIHYVAAALKESADGARFVEFLKTKKAQILFERFGFLPLSATN